MSYNLNTRTGPSFSWANRLQRTLWALAYWSLFRFSPRPLHGWRRWLLRRFGAQVGQGVHVYPSAKIWAPWNLVLGDECGVGDDVTLYAQDKIYLGAKVVVSQGAYLCTGTHDYRDPGFKLMTRPIRVEAEAWIAAFVFVHPGITIGEGAVIGARSVVDADMPAWKVCSGHPCRVVKDRPRIASVEGA